MRILVCISHVPDTTSKITFTDEGDAFNPQGVQYVINPYDEIALSKAVDLASAHNGTVTVIHVGEATAEPSIRKALAICAIDAIRINGALRDWWFVANQIASYAEKNAYDLILTGQESIDFNGTQVAALIGELLQLPSISIAKKLEIEGREALVSREIEGGSERLSVSLPVVIGTAEGVAEPKIPNIRNIMSARSKPLEVIEPITVEALEHITKFETPVPRGAVKIVQDVDQLVALLRTEAKVI